MIENIKYEKSFNKQSGKLVSKNILTQKQIDDTILLYQEDKTDVRLRYHSICCKRDKHRKSISVLGSTQEYKILLAEYETLSNIIFIGHHKKYDRLKGTSKNPSYPQREEKEMRSCKSFFES